MALFEVNFLIIYILHVRVNLRDTNVTTSIQLMGPSGKPIGDETFDYRENRNTNSWPTLVNLISSRVETEVNWIH